MLLQILNKLLELDEPAREKLRGFTGKTLVIDTSPLVMHAQINERGFLVEADTREGVPDLKITLPLTAAPLALLGKDRLTQEARVEGNIAFANAFNEIFAHAPLALEAQTERMIGPIGAHQLKKLGEGIAAGFARLKESVERNAKSAAAREGSALPSPDVVRDWAYQVNGVAMQVNQLAQRIDALSRAR